MSLQDKLELFLPKERIKNRLLDVMTYASDAGFYELIPKVVVQPKSVKEVKALFALSNSEKVPIVFRTGGTSLSGQSITDGILVDLSQHWREISINDDKGSVCVQPGITGAMVNNFLKKYGAKIGPDPSSINSAMMGGILSNNSSGMCCGVAYNSYHTLETIRFVLPNGHEYDTAQPSHYGHFLADEKQLASELTAIRRLILSDDALAQRIRKKYRTKNTVGYGLNALIDYEHPLDIFAHLLIGAEGTLAFIAEATLKTLPDKPKKASAMLYFKDIKAACDSILTLIDSGAEALELMDRASLRSVETMKGLPDFFKDLPQTAAAILCEYQAENADQLEYFLKRASHALSALHLLYPADFTTDESTRNFYWKMRKGMFPSVGAVRQRGTTVLLEDVAFPVEKLAEAVLDLQELFKSFDYDNAIIFGHAKDGNIHFVITQLLDTVAEISRYDRFLRAVVNLVVNKYDGALKAEHGTGRNMAPFVETEWGGALYEVMKRIKTAVDPDHLLNPGVIINHSKTAHLEHLKSLPAVEEEVDKCIECGYCEPVCPSRDFTMTPRRRIVARRVLQRFSVAGNDSQYRQLLSEYQYDGLHTCATDGLCASECPVDINTGDLVKRLRQEQHGNIGKSVAGFMARHFRQVESFARIGISSLVWINNLFGLKLVYQISRSLHRMVPAVPVWMNEVRAAGKIPVSMPQDAQVVYFTACINRVMSSQSALKPSLQQTIFDLCHKAGIKVLLPDDLSGKCCGQPFSSKGFQDASKLLEEKTIDALMEWSRQGEIPIICDFSSCTHTLINNNHHLSKNYQEKFRRLKWVDSVEYLREVVLPRLTIKKAKHSVALHPTCAVNKLYLTEAFRQIAEACANEVISPAYSGCCGMAGDRGFYYPGLTAAAGRMEALELQKSGAEGFYASACTCEIALTKSVGRQYEHIAYLMDEVSE